MDHLDFAQNVTALRHKHGITQEALADFIGVTKASVSKWETGQSLPDIQSLLLLATYYDVTLDELLGYHPSLSKMQIRSLYHNLAKDFATKPFEEVFARSQNLVKTYYSCYNFLLQVGILWFNHFMLAAPDRQKEVLEEIVRLCARIYGNSPDGGLCSDAVVLEAMVKLQMGKAGEVIEAMEEICNPYRFSRNVDSLLFRAYMQVGDTDRADARAQLDFFEAVIAMLDSAMDYLLVHAGELEKCEAMVARVDAMLAQDMPGEPWEHVEASFHYSVAVMYCTHGKADEALGRLQRFAQIVKRMEKSGMRLHGSLLFDRLEGWFEENELGAKPVRNSAVVVESAGQALDNPVFSCLPPDELAAIRKSLVVSD